LVDAPCSGEGLFRKTPEAIQEWSPQHVQLCEVRQRRILNDAWPLVAAGGILIYSTCTYNIRENDQNVAWLLETGHFRTVEIPFESSWGITETEHGRQFYPHRTRSEGFYVAVLERTSPPETQKAGPLNYFTRTPKKDQTLLANWVAENKDFELLSSPRGEHFLVPDYAMPILEHLSGSLRRITPGLPMGQIKGKDLVPAHDLALSLALSEDVPRLEVDRTEALSFLRKEPLSPRSDTGKGWHVLTFQNYGLGWVKILPNRINNYFPQALRIRK
jgi:NOL1/NOP2/fmu family ribosome biogenesis protein